ncbi:MAG: endonuclease/exonuclease/phosphatase family protein [Chlamydiia bacterium]|jgi:endonuclease/exonuclease/phosphatase family metal-dependent hydrolase|nr:endonuclease/exonuclease/phosphatase family protein [Chlamydiia bacterium]
MLNPIASCFVLASIFSQSKYNEEPYICPPLANYIDAPLPQVTTSDQLVGIYLNILYPEDNEKLQKKKLADWIESFGKNSDTPFPFSSEEINDLAIYILNEFPLNISRRYFAEIIHQSLADGYPLETALVNAKEKTLHRSLSYQKAAEHIPSWKGRCEILIEKLCESVDQLQQILELDIIAIRKEPHTALQNILNKTSMDLIHPPFTWNTRIQVFKQMVDKITSTSADSPYFLALQEVTPQALRDLKKIFADRNLKWISLNNMSGKQTLPPQQEKVLGEAVEYTSTLVLSPGLEVLKIELGDLPTESDHIRKILGVRIRDTRTNKIFNAFTTHTDYNIQNNIYERTATKIYEFVSRFFQDDPSSDQRFIIGGDLNSFKGQGGDIYIEKLRASFPGSRDFRETDYYAPFPIAWSSFIGRYEDTYSGRIAKDGIMDPNALDHIIVGKDIELHSASREAMVYDATGKLLDYYKDRDNYMLNIQKGITFSDHFVNVIRFK